MSKKQRAPEGYPNELTFCKRTFPFYGTDDGGRQLYRLDHIIIAIGTELDSGGRCLEAAVFPTSKDHGEERSLATGKGESPQAAAKRAEKQFQATFYKMKPLMER